MSLFIFSALFNAFVAGLLGFVVILKNRKEFVAEFSQRHPDQQEFADDIAY